MPLHEHPSIPVINPANPPKGVVWCEQPGQMQKAMYTAGTVLALTPFHLSDTSRATISRMKLTARMKTNTRRGETPNRWRQPATYLMANEDPFESVGYMVHEAFEPTINLRALQADTARGVRIIQHAFEGRNLSLRVEAQDTSFRGRFHKDMEVGGGTVVYNGTPMQVKVDGKPYWVPPNTIGTWYGLLQGPDHPALSHKHGVTYWWQPLRALTTAFVQ